MDIDYQNDWAGEARNDPFHGNTFVLRSVERWSSDTQYYVNINDIMGGHACTVPLDEWLQWEVNDG